MQNVSDEASATAQTSPIILVTMYLMHFQHANWKPRLINWLAKAPIVDVGAWTEAGGMFSYESRDELEKIKVIPCHYAFR